MGSRELHVVRVPRAVTVVLLILVSLVILVLIWFLSGKAVYREVSSPVHLLRALLRYDRTGAGRANVLASAAPAIAGVLLFVPWGALAFLAFDRVGWSRATTYALTLTVGVTFALGVSAWQEWLPTRITGWLDVFWNVLGAMAGAVVGHLRRRVWIRFES
jgi:glycopeptide antibiotics resistance protein